MLRSILAIVAGLVAMSVLVMAGTMAAMTAAVPGGLGAMKAMRDDPSRMPPLTKRYLVLNIGVSLAAAVVGGLVTARIAGTTPDRQLESLAAMIVIMGVISANAPRAGLQPAWYKVIIPLVGVAGVALAAAFVLRPV